VAAQRICETLRAAGIEVFLDQSELRGGDAWDQKIRHEIHDCALFIPIVSQHTQERLEGYFRHEWNLAIERAHHMAQQKLFLLPVVVDGTRDQEATVPDAFRAVQWTHLPGGDTPPAFVERIKRLLAPELSPLSAVSGAAPEISGRVPPSQPSKRVLLAIVVVVVFAALAYLVADKLSMSKHLVPSPDAFAPPPHSVAVLPFVNMSGDKEQDYFSDGLSEELLNSLARINELQVAARTSSFYFKGEHADLSTIAHKLNVASVLEGSVRRAGNTIRVTAQLNNAVTGFHLWSQSYDRDLGDVLKMQAEIANAVASALKVTLLGDVAAKIELGGTSDPTAFDAYLRGSKAYNSGVHDPTAIRTAIAAYTEAISLDPNYALAFAGRSIAYLTSAVELPPDAGTQEAVDRAQADARDAIKLAPGLAEGHLALARFLQISLDFAQSNDEFEQALTLAPGDVEVLRESGRSATYMGRFDTGIAAASHAAVLDPLNPRSYSLLGQTFYWARRYEEAIGALAEVITLDPEYRVAYGVRGLGYYGLGDLQNARSSCQIKADYWVSRLCLAVVYDKLGRHADAEAELKKIQTAGGDANAYQYAAIYAQWGDHAKALKWLDVARRLRDPGLLQLKTDPLIDPLRKEPRLLAIERELKFPD
jgi:TolB-like protein/Flp pilus assembly protein TadD